jgi:hypothetical protein
MLCDAPLVLSSLIRLGYGEDRRVERAATHLLGLVRANGFPCVVSSTSKGFHGPGSQKDPCPYANLLMLQLLAQEEAWRDSQAARMAAETLLQLWSQSRERHPYLFHMGTDFRKLKMPYIWYDILHLADVLTRFSWLRWDERLREILSVIESKADREGRYRPESVWQDWKGWDFGQKKQASRWMTLSAYRTLARLD